MKKYLLYKDEIIGYQDVLETVKTEEQVAAADIHDLKVKVNNLKIFEANIIKVLDELSNFYFDRNNQLLQSNNDGKKILIFVGANKGLVGGLYNNLFKFVVQQRENYHGVVVIGTRVIDYFKDWEILEKFKGLEVDLNVQDIKKINDFLLQGFLNKNFNKIDIAYTQYVSLSEQKPVIVPFLPFSFKATSGLANDKKEVDGSLGLPIIEPSAQKIFAWYLQQYINLSFFKIIIEAKLAELAARTVSLDDATDKAKKLIIKLQLDYFKERKRSLTQKQIEIFAAHNLNH